MSEKPQAPVINIPLESSNVATATATTTTTSSSSPPQTNVKPKKTSTPSSTSSASLNKTYLKSPLGFLRLLLIILYLGGWISASSIPKLYSGRLIPLPSNYEEVRSAYLFFTVTGFLASIILYIIVLINLVHANVLNKLPWILLVFISDVIWSVPIFVISIICAVKETEFRRDSTIFSINIGTYAAASFFGFACVIALLGNGVFHVIKLIRDGFRSNYP